jgi:cytochrome c5
MRWTPPLSRRLLAAGSAVCVMACGERSPDEATDAPAAGPVGRDGMFLASARVALPPEGVRLEDLPDPTSEGAQFVARYCTECHALATPQVHSAADWPPIVRRMWLRIEGLDPSYGAANPTSAERVVLLRYLMEHGLEVHRTALPDEPGRDTFASACGRCHGLPSPDSHAREEWADVVVRMSALTASMVGAALSQEEIQLITQYLELVASGR